MSHFYVDEQPLVDSSSAGVTFPNDSIYESSDVPDDTTYDHFQSPLQPQNLATLVDKGQNVHHASWAPDLPAPEVTPPSVSGPGEILYSLIYCSLSGVSPTVPKAKQRSGPLFIFWEARKTASRANPIVRHCRQRMFRVMMALSCHRITCSCSL